MKILFAIEVNYATTSLWQTYFFDLSDALIKLYFNLIHFLVGKKCFIYTHFQNSIIIAKISQIKRKNE